MIYKFSSYKFYSIYFVLYVSLLAGFLFNENSTGGAIVDYANQKKAVNDFASNFFVTFYNYENYGTRHSPILIIFLSFLKKLEFSDINIRLLHLHLSLALPILFYFILNEKFNYEKKYFFYALVGLLFLSPTYRTLSIWPDSRLMGLIFFCISIIFYLKFTKSKKKKFCYLNIIFLSLSSYLSPNFAVFSIFFFYNFFISFKKDFNFLIKITLLNISLALPAFYYLFILNINFLNQPAAVGLNNNLTFFNNISNNILLISSIILFYLVPFLQIKIIVINKFKPNLVYLLILIFFLVCIFFFDYNFKYTGGGIFYKISFYLFKNNILFYLISFLSFIVIFLTLKHNISNLLLLTCLLLNNPQITVYHKYYDPLLIILFFSVLDLKIKNFNLSLSKYAYLYFYFFIFLILNIFKSNV